MRNLVRSITFIHFEIFSWYLVGINYISDQERASHAVMVTLSCFEWTLKGSTGTSEILLNSLHAVSFLMLSFWSADFFQNLLFQKIISGIPSACQTVWIQIRTNILLVLTWIKTVCRQQKLSPAGKSLSVNNNCNIKLFRVQNIYNRPLILLSNMYFLIIWRMKEVQSLDYCREQHYFCTNPIYRFI